MVSVISTLMLDVSYAVEILLVFMFAGGVRFHTSVAFLIQSVVVLIVACVIFIPGFSPCRGYWVWVVCCLFVVCIYMLGWLCRATCYFVSTFQCLVYHLLSRWKEALEFTYRVIVKVLVLGLLVVVYEKIVSCEYDHLNGWNSTLNFASCMVHQTHSYNKRVFAKVRF